MSQTCSVCGSDYSQCHVGNRSLTGGGRSGMVCSSWGTPKWYCMHMIARDYPDPEEGKDVPDEVRRHYLEWLTVQQYILPCCCCRSHFGNHLKKLGLTVRSPYFKNTKSFFRLTFDLHNTVNKTLGKPVLGEKDLVKLLTYYGASRAAKTEEYGRAFVVVQPAKKTEKGSHSILIDNGLVKKNCKLADATAPDHECIEQ